jgi:glycosyltransferase involved in cell wall biosynthesis
MHLLAVTATNDRSEVELYRALAARGHRVDVICAPRWQGARQFDGSGVTVTRLDVRHRLDLRAARRLRVIIDALHPDIIYAPRNSTLSAALLATKRRCCPVIGYRGTTGHLSRLDPASWLTYFHPRLKGIVCVSDAVRRYLLSKHIPDQRLRTIYKGHRAEWYDFDLPVDLSSLGIPRGAFVVGFTGNMRPVKGVDVLLQALAALPADFNVHALLIGEVRDKRIARMAADPVLAGRTHFTGYRTDAPMLAGACDAFVMPSIKREGLPRAVIEAMAQRVPVIVSAVGGMPELVEDGVSGLVVPPRNATALARAIQTLATDRTLSRTLGQAARRRIEETFNIETTIDSFQEWFETLAGTPAANRLSTPMTTRPTT